MLDLRNLLVPAGLVLISSASMAADPPASRGPLVLYTFEAGRGATVHDRSGNGSPLDLTIENPASVEWRGGALVVRSSAKIATRQPAKKLIDAIRRSRELTIEVWARPANDKQNGPARVVSLSADPNQRNVTLGQDGARYDVRLRTTATTANGLPSTSTPKNCLKPALTHVVYTRDAGGTARIFINGRQSAAKKVAGDFSNWNGAFRLSLANELTGDRPWLGELHRVAIYSRAISGRQVAQNHAGGSRAAATAGTTAGNRSGPQRSALGVLALYTFDAGQGETVRDRSGLKPPLDLKIEKPSAVEWKQSELVIRSATKIASPRPAQRISAAIAQTGAATIEVWISPANLQQKGPARVVSLSRNTGERNFTLGQEGNRFDARFRTSTTGANGIPSLASPKQSAATRLTHVVYTRSRSGRTRFYINGKQSSAGTSAGALSNWNGEFPLVLANELTSDRPWLGSFHLVAIYNRDLAPAEVKQNFQAGARAEAVPERLARADNSPSARLFETEIAGVLANNCLECHDAASSKGKLDLSRKAAALAGGESGKAIVPGKAGESLLWEMIESDAMPQDRPPLSSQQKGLVRKWIDAGADWPLETIDPAVYAHGGGQKRGLRRLTVREYIETVRSAVGVDIAKQARELLPPDVRADGFSNTSYNLNVDLKHVEAYARLAEIAVGRMDVLKFAQRFSNSRSLSTDATMRKFVAAMGKWLLRGPLDESEVTAYSGIATTVASAGGDFQEAAGLIIEAMLQSPRFLYRVENQRGDGSAWPVGDWELASRLSYILWGAPPDAELMRAAEAGELADRSNASAQIRRMLDDPRTIEKSLQFVDEWMNLGRVQNLRPDPKRFPEWNDRLAADMRAETWAFFKYVAWEKQRPLSELLNTQVTFATPALARHYGLKPQGEGVRRYDLSSVPARGGLLTQGSVLTVGGDEASMVSRGLFVFQDLLRGVVKDPPPCVDTRPVPTKPGLTQRGVAETRLANMACAGCHAKFEPLAFGLEKYDGIGAYHEQDEHGNRLRDDGNVLFPGAEKAVSYKSSQELMNLLAASERVRETITWKLTQFALGRPLGARDARSVAAIHEAAQQTGGTYRELIAAILMSDLVQTTRTEADR